MLVTMALAAYVHRRVVDPTRLPSALPPAPPGATASTVHDHRPDTRRTDR